MDYKEFMFRMYVKEIEADIIDPNGFSHTIGNTVTCKCGGHYEFRQKKSIIKHIVILNILIKLKEIII